MTLPLSLLVAHFIGDFVFQSNWMALNKSKSWLALTAHVTIYAATIGCWGCGVFVLAGFPWDAALARAGVFAGLTFVTHFVTDAITSRMTTALWFIPLYPREPVDIASRYQAYPYFAYVEEKRRHWFFVVIGLDQLIHAATLAWTWDIVLRMQR